MRILVAEDDFDARQMLQALLQLEGHSVTTAANGNEAWDTLLKGKFSVVLSDWLMPECDGLELCRRIRAVQTAHYLYVILVTALSGKSNYLDAINAGADDFVSKPYDPEVLTSRLLVAERIVSLQDRVKRLEGIMRTCMYCKKVRDESDRWVSIESYITHRSDASFSHGVCPDCYNTIVKPEIDRSRST